MHLESIADTAAEVDFAMRWGFGWSTGPFEDWQEAGWLQIAQWVQQDIDAGKALSKEPLPKWVFESDAAKLGQVHSKKGSWSPARQDFILRSSLPVYKKQIFRASLKGDGSVNPKVAGETIFENEGVRAWVDDSQKNVLILSFKSKMNTIGPDVLDGIADAINLAEKSYDGLVIWQPTSLMLGSSGAAFSAGANLEAAMPLFMKGGPAGIEPFVQKFQDTMLRVKYANVPVVAAVSGIALGGGCELLLHAAKRVVAIESYVGLVEIGVGLLPAGGGLKEAAIRGAKLQEKLGNNNYLDCIKTSFENAALAKVSSSAHEARSMGYLNESDVIVVNVHELLYQAQMQVKYLAISGYRPPLQRLISVGGRSVISTVSGQLVNMLEGGFISQHDFLIAKKIIEVIAGGDVDAGTQVPESWLLKLERQAFVELLGTSKTQERIMGLLQTGKPVRN